MPNTARHFALLVGSSLREPLAKLGAHNFELGVSIRRHVTAIVVGLSRLDVAPPHRWPARRTQVCRSVSDLIPVLSAGRALGDIAEDDYQRVLDAVDRLVDAITADALAEVRAEREAAELESGPELESEDAPPHLAAEVEAPF